MILGLLGYIGAGKSTIRRYLTERYQFMWIDADNVTKKIYKNQSVINFLREHFPDVVDIGGAINFKKLRGMIFNDPEANHTLTTFLWPIIERNVLDEVHELQMQHHKRIVIEGVGLHKLVNLPIDHFLFITAPEKALIERVAHRDQADISETTHILQFQKQLYLTLPSNCTVITTTADPQFAFEQVDSLLAKLGIK